MNSWDEAIQQERIKELKEQDFMRHKGQDHDY